MKELELASRSSSITQLPSATKVDSFDAARNIRLVDKFFLHFEKVAVSLKWPKDVWTLMLQSVFIGKAREIYAALAVDQSADYDLVKEAILKGNELVPEAYRQTFRYMKKQFDQTHVEFVRDKEQLFDRWLTSKNVKENVGELRKLMLIEEFKQYVNFDIKTHLDERKVDNLHQAATMADDYALTHKLSFVKKGMENTGFHKNKLILNTPANVYDPSKGSSTLGSIDKDKSSYNTSGGSSMTSKGVSSAIPMCAYCKKKGHLMSECWTLKRKEERRSQLSSNACTAVKNILKPVYLENSEVEVKRSESEFIKEEFKPFVSEGFVSLKGDNANLHPIKIMRDTGASQSLLLEGILPLSAETSAGASVLIQGVELGFIKVPLHVVELKSDFVCGSVTVGVRPTLPIEGVSLLLGNDLAGDKVIVNPIVSDKLCFEDDCDEHGNADIFPACAVTRAMEK